MLNNSKYISEVIPKEVMIMLSLQLPYINNERYSDCIHAINISLAYNFGFSYHRLFALYWGFKYNPDKDKEFIEWFNRGGLIHYHQYDIEAMTGIQQCEKHVSDIKQLKTIINNYSKNQVPITSKMDLFYLPGELSYSNIHIDHYLLSLGFDENGNLHCQDPYHNKNTILLEQESLLNLSMTYIENNKATERYNSKLTDDELLFLAADNYRKEVEENNSGLDQFGTDILDNPVAYESLFHIQSPDISPFFIKLNSLVLDRMNFFDYFNRIMLMKGANKASLTEAMIKCRQNWRSAFLLLSKAISRKQNRLLLLQTSEKFKQIAENEYQIANDIICCL